MKVTILGCGPAGGVPSISKGWGKCDPNEPKNRRLRPSILVEEGGRKILVDTSPDLRQQLLAHGIGHLDALIYTHAHADHICGLDDIREVNRAMNGPVQMFAAAHTLEVLKRRFDYAFKPRDLTAEIIYAPLLETHVVDGPFEAAGVRVVPFEQDHGWSQMTLGLRFGPIVYSTDVVDLPEAAFDVIRGAKIWIVGCIGDGPHPTHAHVDKALAWAERVGPIRLVITHMAHSLDYRSLKARLPDWAEPAYDGLVLEAFE